VLRANFQKAISYTPLERAESLRSDMVEAAESADTLEEKESAVLLAIRKSGLYSNTAELQSGYVIGRYNLERSYYGDMTDAALELELGEVSDPIEVVSDVENSYYVIYKTLKSEEHLEANYESIRYIFLMNCVGEISHSVASDLKASVVYTEVLNGIDYSRIAM
jgi:hypothetical protein